MNKKQEILKLFYEQNIKGTDIANIIHVSKSYISQVIKTDSRYENKKKEQKENTIIRKREYTKQKMKEIREIKAQQDAFIKQQHLQAARELSSKNKIINNIAFRKWNSSAYKYNQNIRRYEFDGKLTRSYAIPKYIKINNKKNKV